jgi:hypothetical protein
MARHKSSTQVEQNLIETDKPATDATGEPTDKPADSSTVASSEKPTDESNNKAANNFYQAIGILSGKLTFSNGFKISLDGKQYNIRFKSDKLLYFVELEKVGRFAVYPKFTHFPGRDATPNVYFEVVAISYSDTNSSTGLFEKMQDNEFILSGLWQFIPVCRTPVVSVMHNYNDDLLAKIAKLNTAAKCRKLKAQHLPLVWKPPIVPAFRYQKDAEVQEEKYFISVKAKFDTKREEFIFDAIIGMPTTEVPRGFVVGKKMKAEALQGRKEYKPTESTKSFALTGSTTNKTAKKQPPKPPKSKTPPPKPKAPVSKPIKREE